jgi:hypothetical protein
MSRLPRVARIAVSPFLFLALFTLTGCANPPAGGFDRRAPSGDEESGDPNYLPPDRAPKPTFVSDQKNISTLAMDFEARQFHDIANWASANEEVRYDGSVVAQAERDADRARRLIAQRAISLEEFLIAQHILRHSQFEYQIAQLRRDLAETQAETSGLHVRDVGGGSNGMDLRREIAAKLTLSYKRTKAMLLVQKDQADDDAAHAAELYRILVRAGEGVSAKEREDGFLRLLGKQKDAIKIAIEIKYTDQLIDAMSLTEHRLQ